MYTADDRAAHPCSEEALLNAFEAVRPAATPREIIAALGTHRSRGANPMVVRDNPSFDHPREEGEVWGELSGADVGRMLEVDRSVPGPGANGEDCDRVVLSLIKPPGGLDQFQKK